MPYPAGPPPFPFSPEAQQNFSTCVLGPQTLVHLIPSNPIVGRFFSPHFMEGKPTSLRLSNAIHHPVGGGACGSQKGLSEPHKGLTFSILRAFLLLSSVVCRKGLLVLLGVGAHSFFPSVSTRLSLKTSG